MNFINFNGADAFYITSLRSYDVGIIGINSLHERMACLLDMLDPSDRRFDEIKKWIPSDLLEQISSSEELEGEGYTQEIESIIPENHQRRLEPEGIILHFRVTGIKGMKKWEFHQLDADPHPSVPHGHKCGGNHPKLDPYTGRVYGSGRNEIVRERLNKQIKAELWNDASFREFALKAILWYEGTYPHYSFRVKNPHRLPLPRQKK